MINFNSMAIALLHSAKANAPQVGCSAAVSDFFLFTTCTSNFLQLVCVGLPLPLLFNKNVSVCIFIFAGRH
jgi:hypothetical protein